MKERIVVIGGYGQVGKTICKELGELYPGKVYAAGRSMERADQFCRTTDGKVRPMKVDVKEKMNPEFWSNIKLIIMCLDQTDLSFVCACLESGTHYTDISADYSFLSKVEALHEDAVNNRATAVLNVGLSPGLTNLMARHVANLMDRTDAIDIALLFGLGNQHGKAGIEWIIDNLGMDFHVMKNGKPVEVAGFSDGKTTDFGPELGKWSAYRFNFFDQHSLPLTLGVPNVSTRMCLDNRALNKGLALFKATGLTKLLQNKWIRDAAVHLFGSFRVGKDRLP